MQDKIRAILDSASAEQRNAGMVWYEAAHVWCSGIAEEYNIPLAKACAVVAVLSPACSWRQNMLDTVSLVKTWRSGTRDAACCTYSGQVAKAYAILDAPNDADILSLVGKPEARKTRAFFDNIYNPHISMAVTIDRHIARALGTMGEQATKVSAKAYATMADAIAQVSKQYSILPSQVQAIIWCVVRGTGE